MTLKFKVFRKSTLTRSLVTIRFRAYFPDQMRRIASVCGGFARSGGDLVTVSFATLSRQDTSNRRGLMYKRHWFHTIFLFGAGFLQFGCASCGRVTNILYDRDRLERRLYPGMTIQQTEVAIGAKFIPLSEGPGYYGTMTHHYLICWSPVDPDEAITLRFDVGYRLEKWFFEPRENYPYCRDIEKLKNQTKTAAQLFG